MQPLGVKTLCRLTQRSLRFGALDPMLNAARVAGFAKWGAGISALVHASALRWPNRTAVVDDHGSMSYRQLDRMADGLTNYLRSDGNGPVGLLCRNHRGFPLAQIAIERAGRDVVMLSTALPAQQLRDIADREALTLLIADAEFLERIDQAGVSARVVPADPDQIGTWSKPGPTTPPPRRSEMIVLTSGTTGPPKGARRSNRPPRISDASLLDAIPIRMNDVTLIASPLFHAWGLAQCSFALATGSTIVVHAKFDPNATLRAVAEHGVSVLAAVPLMLSRILEETPPGNELTSLRATLCSGNVLSATLAKNWIERFGPNLYNIYGSTETAVASVATPKDLLAAPGTVGRPPRGVTVAILDDGDKPAASNQLGRVFTANSQQFAGYTDGSNRARRGRLMATGDLGYLDNKGRLFVDGRENDLIVTGGENVFPSLIEEVLEQHDSVLNAAVVGLPDAKYGQRVVAFVVANHGFDVDELDAWARQNLAAFQRPREYRSVDALPMTTTGKVIRHALATLGLAEHI